MLVIVKEPYTCTCSLFLWHERNSIVKCFHTEFVFYFLYVLKHTSKNFAQYKIPKGNIKLFAFSRNQFIGVPDLVSLLQPFLNEVSPNVRAWVNHSCFITFNICPCTQICVFLCQLSGKNKIKRIFWHDQHDGEAVIRKIHDTLFGWDYFTRRIYFEKEIHVIIWNLFLFLRLFLVVSCKRKQSM